MSINVCSRKGENEKEQGNKIKQKIIKSQMTPKIHTRDKENTIWFNEGGKEISTFIKLLRQSQRFTFK